MGEKKIHKLLPQKPVSFQIAGIVSQEKIFILSNEFRRLTDLKLDQLISIKIPKNEVMQMFNSYSSLPDESGKVISLISNRCSDGILMESFKNIDYFLTWSSETPITADLLLVKKIKESKLILGISILTLNSSKENKSFLEIINLFRH